MAELLMGIDVGTHETQGVLVDTTGKFRGEARSQHDISIPQPGRVEHDADRTWWDGLVKVARLLANTVETGDTIVGLGCSGIGPCVVPVDDQFCPLRPAILYGVDTRAANEIDELRELLGEQEIARRCGTRLTSQSGGPKIRWLTNNEPDLTDRTRWYLTSQSYLAAKLVGEVSIDHASAGFFHPLYDPAIMGWNPAGLAEHFDFDKLPEVRWASEISGYLSPAAATETLLPTGLPVVVGTSRVMAEAVGATVREPGDLMLMYGSGGFLLQVVKRPATEGSLWSAPYALPERFVLAAGTSTAGTATRWVCELLGLDDKTTDRILFRELMELARTAPAGAGGVLHLPHFCGERTPFYDLTAKGSFTGLGLDCGRAELARAVCEGVAHSMALALNSLLEEGDRPTGAIAIGGGVRNEIWTQAVSDLTGLTQLPVHSIGAALGDAMLAGIGIGAVSEADTSNWVRFEAPIRPKLGDHPDVMAIKRSHARYLATYQALRCARLEDDQ